MNHQSTSTLTVPRPTSYTLPDLPFATDALAPVMSAQVVELHHDKHHAAYVKGVNETFERLADATPWQTPGLEQSLAFHLGGHLLHSLLWTCLSPTPQRPTGSLQAAIDDQYGSFEVFQTQFSQVLTTIQGSGWAVLSWEPTGQRLVIEQVHDHHGTHVMAARPLFVADGWEHAYYLDHHSDKAAWAAAVFTLANWESVAERFNAAVTAGMTSTFGETSGSAARFQSGPAHV